MDLFAQLLGDKGPYKGMYPGADPYNKAQMIQEGIPSADQEALQKPTIDPIMAPAMAMAPGMQLNPMGVFKDAEAAATTFDVNGLFSYLMNQATNGVMKHVVSEVRDTPIEDLHPMAAKQGANIFKMIMDKGAPTQ